MFWSVQSNISFLKMVKKKKKHTTKSNPKPFLQFGKKCFSQSSCFLSPAYQTPLKAILLLYIPQFTPKR